MDERRARRRPDSTESCLSSRLPKGGQGGDMKTDVGAGSQDMHTDKSSGCIIYCNYFDLTHCF